jgi:hypothetical protein
MVPVMSRPAADVVARAVPSMVGPSSEGSQVTTYSQTVLPEVPSV